jgi:hypothetical protein
MGLITKEVEVRLINNIKYYEDKGYKIPKYQNKNGRLLVSKNTKIKVKVEDLPLNSHVFVQVMCDQCGKLCGEEDYIHFSSYNKHQRNGQYYCKKCGTQLFGMNDTKKTKLQKSGCIVETAPWMINYLVNKEDAYKYSSRSSISLYMICPSCGYKKLLSPDKLFGNGFACPCCSDGISYPEKIVFNILVQLNIDFETQYMINNFRYDFYLSQYNYIIETHGRQHYEMKQGFYKDKLVDIQENDELKKQLAEENGINYIILDCRESNLTYIKDSVLLSKLSAMFDLSNIDWMLCHKNALQSKIQEACDLWSGGIHSTKLIANKMKLGRHTITRYLKQGTQLGLCNYNTEEAKQKNYKSLGNPVICINTGIVYKSALEVKRQLKIDIYACCHDKATFAGKDTNGNRLHWMFYKDYLIMQEDNKTHTKQDIG